MSSTKNIFTKERKHLKIFFGLVLSGAMLSCAVHLSVFSPKAHADAASEAAARTNVAKRLAGNINISVPSQVSYVAKADGTLLTPSSNALYLQNNSGYEVRVSKVQVNAATGWQFVEDAEAVSGTQENAAELTITPISEIGTDTTVTQSGDINEIVDSTLNSKKIIHTSSQSVVPLEDSEPMWTMTAADANAHSEDTQASQLHFEIEGAVASSNISNRAAGTIGSTQWYVVADTVTNDFRNRISTLEGENSSLKNRVSNLEGQVNTLTNEKSQLQNDLSNAENRLSTLDGINGSVANLSNRLTTAESGVSNLTSAVGNSSSGLTKRVGDLSNALNTTNSTINTLQQSVDKRVRRTGYIVSADMWSVSRDEVIFDLLYENNTRLYIHLKSNGTVVFENR